ncbi:C40 family peptidase [Galbibacter sp. EGI 63066]|uniref:C40 family peptidase n=1 Tax=Galbibacter sp. EGI 63066 TaxID=2993559 RepID=UPI002248C2CE|nr:C40 family peptidase [Galbibacter sp. EGI 63066]MCX2678611.1 C40 family peptidase [Galbibacter sp. EGI 63066]
MQYGICHLSIVPLRNEPLNTAELSSQVLYGEHFKVLERRKHWSKIRIAFDKYEGWINNTQYQLIDEDIYKAIDKEDSVWSADLVEFIYDKQNNLLPIPLGCNVGNTELLSGSFDGATRTGILSKENIVETAFLYLNSPFLWGGKTPFGIDSSGLAQMVYKLNGYHLLRDAAQQSTQGEALSFIEESEPGDLAFFDDEEGNIIHVGIIMKDNYIIHTHGKVRIDRIDHSGIFNIDTKTHTHKLRVIKKIV